LPFLLERRSIIVLTHMIRLDSTEIERFAACAFEQFPSVDIITLNSVQAELTNFPYPVIRSYSRDDVVITLPSTADAYTATLGKSTRKNLRRYRARLQKKFPSVRFQTYEKTEIDEKIIQDLIKLSELRVTAKQMKFGTSKNYTKGMIELAMAYGVLNVISIDGHLCSGIISYRVGNSQFAEVIAHNEMYNDFSPGMLCCYWAICESITKGVGQFHMGSGLLEYKIWLLGIQKNMEKFEIYRSQALMVLNCDWVMRTICKSFILRLKTWLRRHEDSLPVRFLLESRTAMRKMRKGR
jgi:CelD/BcsL family acetyltransferase involved in cellulose biosynthesis